MFKKTLLSLLAVVVIFEEWLWDILTLAGQWLADVLQLERFDEQLAQAKPPQAVLYLLFPLAIVTPINIIAIFLLTHGAIVEGLLLEVVAKLFGTLLIARVFKLVKPALLRLDWFASFYHAIMRLLNWAHELIHDSAIYRWSVIFKTHVKQRMRWLFPY